MGGMTSPAGLILCMGSGGFLEMWIAGLFFLFCREGLGPKFNSIGKSDNS